jgi:hypothetical protein
VAANKTNGAIACFRRYRQKLHVSGNIVLATGMPRELYKDSDRMATNLLY